MITKLLTFLIFTVPAFAQFTIPMRTGALAKTGGGGTTPASWDTTPGTSCNPLITVAAFSYSCNLTNVSAGSMIVIGYFLGANTALSSVTVDGAAATVVIDQTLAGSFGRQGVYYLANATSGSHTVTLTYPTNPTPPALFVKSIIGAPTSSPIDGTPTGAVFTVGSGVAFSCGAFTTTQSNDFIVAWGMTSGATQITAGSGFTLFPGVNLNSGNTGGAFESQVGATAGSYNPGFTNGVGGHQGCIGFAIKHL